MGGAAGGVSDVTATAWRAARLVTTETAATSNVAMTVTGQTVSTLAVPRAFKGRNIHERATDSQATVCRAVRQATMETIVIKSVTTACGVRTACQTVVFTVTTSRAIGLTESAQMDVRLATAVLNATERVQRTHTGTFVCSIAARTVRVPTRPVTPSTGRVWRAAERDTSGAFVIVDL